jgi:hypothetical protein
MADSEHLQVLKLGVKAWNEWRDSNPYVRPDLREVDLQGIDIRGAYLAEADLSLVDFSGRDLSGMHLDSSDFTEAKFNNANLTKADLRRSIFFRSDLIGANLEGAELQAADFRQAYLMKANLRRIYLGGVDFTQAALTHADLTESTLNGTVFGENYLDEVIGLDSVIHNGPSVIGIATIYRSKGNIPEAFLRGAGVPDNFITYMRSLAGQAIEFYSCFISYSSKDHEIAERLYADLQAKGVRCWFAPEDLKIGDKFRQRIDESIRLYDKLLLVLSEDSISSSWVEDEVESALERERNENRLVLFPIRIDDAVENTQKAWAASLRRQRHIGDFTSWKDHDAYQKSFERLLRDLRSAAPSSTPA